MQDFSEKSDPDNPVHQALEVAPFPLLGTNGLDADEIGAKEGAGLDEKLLAGLRFDLTSQFYSYLTIAHRYGFKDEAGLLGFLKANPGFVSEVKRMRALFASGLGSAERARLKAVLACEDVLPEMYFLARDGKLPASTRLDIFKQLNRMGGIDGLAPAARDNAGAAGTQFSLTINLPGAAQEELLTTVVRDAAGN